MAVTASFVHITSKRTSPESAKRRPDGRERTIEVTADVDAPAGLVVVYAFAIPDHGADLDGPAEVAYVLFGEADDQVDGRIETAFGPVVVGVHGTDGLR